MKLTLASNSPQRKILLEQLGLAFTILSQDIDESVKKDESPEMYVKRVAYEKASHAVTHKDFVKSALCLAADTIVTLDNEILLKPQDPNEAFNLLSRLSGKAHEVFTAISVNHEGLIQSALSKSTVHFKALSDDEINTYIETGESFGRAGAYAIQGRAASFISHLDGSYSGVMGLPLYETSLLLNSF